LPGCVAQVTSINIFSRMVQGIRLNKLARAAPEKRSDDGMRIGIELGQDFFQRSHKQIADHQTLTEVQIAKRVHVQPARFD